MWGGIVARAQLHPLSRARSPRPSCSRVGGLMIFPDPWYALLPALAFIVIHLDRGQYRHARPWSAAGSPSTR